MISLFISLRVCAFMYMQVCKPIWLGLYDDRNLVIPDFRELQKLKEFLQDKYERSDGKRLHGLKCSLLYLRFNRGIM